MVDLAAGAAVLGCGVLAAATVGAGVSTLTVGLGVLAETLGCGVLLATTLVLALAVV